MKHYETHAIAAIVAIVAIVPGKCRWTRWPTGIPRGSLAHLPSLSLWVYAEWSEWLELALSRGSILRYIMILYDIILCVYIYICYTVYHCILRTLGMRAPLGFSSASARLQLGFSSASARVRSWRKFSLHCRHLILAKSCAARGSRLWLETTGLYAVNVTLKT